MEQGGGVRHTALISMAMIAMGLLFSSDRSPTDNQQAGVQTTSPNIVFVMADDLDERSMEDLDSLSQLMGGTNGTTFQNAYVTYSLCCPSRATILRGQYTHNHTILGNIPREGGGEQKFRDLGRDQSTVATWLKGGGYRTSYIGKYMNGYGISDDTTYIPPGWDEWFVLNRRPSHPNVNDNGQSITITGHSTDVFAQEASDFILRSSENPEPFFAVVGTQAPHIPPAVAERHAGAFADTPLPQPANFDEEFIDDKPQWLQQYPELSQEQIDALEQLYRERLRSMLSVEDLLREIVATLQETGELDNTYLFFTSDNGYHYGHHRLYPAAKQTPYEEDIGVPLMVRGPGASADEVRKQLILNNDFAPTIAELAGVSTPAFVDGRSFAPLLTGSAPYASRSAFLEEGWFIEGGIPTPTHKSAHTRNHMFTEYLDTGEHELYDLVADPFQLQSMTQANNPQLYSTLQRRLDALRACSGAICRAHEWDTRVISTIPNANATVVAPTANIRATFSEDMMVSSINATTFKLFEKGSTTKTAAALTYDASTDTAALDPNEPLKSGITYKAIVSTGAKDVAGNPLDQNTTTTGLQQKTWSFTVG